MREYPDLSEVNGLCGAHDVPLCDCTDLCFSGGYMV
jgi:hypothetical protein